MSDAKIPTDRKAKKGHAWIGDEQFKIRENLDDDWHFTELVAESQAGGMSATIQLVQHILNDSPEAYTALKAACVVDGRVSATKMAEWMESAMELASPNS